MAEMLLINPRRRRKSGAKKRRSNPTPAQRRARARFAAMARGRAASARRAPARASNPIGRSRRRRRSNPVVAYRRRRRNPIGGVSTSGVLNMLRDAAVQGAGAVALDIGVGYVTRMLPTSMQPTAGQIGVGTIVRAALTAAAGQALSGVTRGLSRKAATGSLAVQMYHIAKSFVPASLPVGRVGYVSPAGRVVNMSQRINPNRVGMLAPPGASQLLNAYTAPGASMLLSRARREGAIR